MDDQKKVKKAKKKIKTTTSTTDTKTTEEIEDVEEEVGHQTHYSKFDPEGCMVLYKHTLSISDFLKRFMYCRFTDCFIIF